MTVKGFVLLSMIFCHIIDDYYLQGILASMKQKNWWQKNAPDHLYRHDYNMALVMHAMSWSFMIMLPLALYYHFETPYGMVLFLLNTCVHDVVDDMKANKKRINLVIDQLIHIVQIFVTWAIVML